MVGTITPGWKRFASRYLQRLAEYIWFPDLRGEWLRSGRRALVPLLQRLRPDVVISSHEPATTLQLGLLARNMGFPWIADLGDPVLAPYTLPRWRERAFALEREVCASAERILVTAESAGLLLARRHGRCEGIELLTQGFDDRAASGPAPDRGLFDPDRLELLYTGSFYSFRSPDALIEAILKHPTARLTVASIVAPASIVQACRSHPNAFRLLGFLPHSETLRLQRQADVLVSIANRDGAQVPGKFYEYLGACRPILHLRDGKIDAAASVIDRLRRGYVCDNEQQAISARTGQLAEAKHRRQLDAGFHLDSAAVAEFGWSRIAGRLEHVLTAVLPPRPAGSPGRAPAHPSQEPV